MFEKQPFTTTRHPVKQPSPNMDMFDLPPGDPFVEFFEVPQKTAAVTPDTITDNLFEEQEPLVQLQTIEQTLTPEPNLQEQEPNKGKNWGKFANADSPVWHYHPARKGPTLWWQKDSSTLDPVTKWHRQHPMSPYFKAPEVDNRHKKDDTGPRKPSHGRSAEWYVEGD